MVEGNICNRPGIRTVSLSLADAPDDPDELFSAAMKRASDEAGPGAFMLSWKDARTGMSSPNVESCGGCDMEGWEQYAIKRGADLRVEVGGGDYVFMYLTGEPAKT